MGHAGCCPHGKGHGADSSPRPWSSRHWPSRWQRLSAPRSTFDRAAACGRGSRTTVARIEDDGRIRIDGSLVGRFESDGTVRRSGSIVGRVEDDGVIRRSGSIIGRIEPDGTMRRSGSIIGRIESGGTIRRNGSIWGSASNCCGTHGGKRAVAAVLVFFSSYFEKE
jgi:hypothetical protein